MRAMKSNFERRLKPRAQVRNQTKFPCLADLAKFMSRYSRQVAVTVALSIVGYGCCADKRKIVFSRANSFSGYKKKCHIGNVCLSGNHRVR